MRLLKLEPMEPTLGGRLFRAWMVTFFMGLAAVAVLLTWSHPRQDRLAEERRLRLVSTTGEVTSTETRAWGGRRRSPSWEVTIWYRFVVRGQQYLGYHATFSRREIKFTQESAASAYAAGYPAGRLVTVWYDEADPRDSALEPSYEPITFMVPYALAIGGAGFALGLTIARRTLREARARPLPASERRKGFRICAGAAAVVALASAGLLVADGAPLLRHRWRQASLATAPASLMDAVEVHYESIPVVSYRFQPEPPAGVIHEGSAWRFGRTIVSTEQEARDIAARLADDSRAERLVVHYDPDEPAYNALRPEYGTLLTSWTAPAVAAALLLALLALRSTWLRARAAV